MSALMSPAKLIRGFVGWLLLSFCAAAVGGYGSRNAPGFYAALRRPNWAPPAGWFGPVWTVLYLSMAVAAWLVWRRGGWSTARRALAVFILQLALNALWPWTFFAWHSGLLSTVVIVLLWLAILLTIKYFWSVEPAAGSLLLPYLAWVTYAGALNVTLWQGNQGVM